MNNSVSKVEYTSYDVGNEHKLYGVAGRVDNYTTVSSNNIAVLITPPPGSSSLKNEYDIALANELSEKHSLPVFLFENPGKNKRGNPERDYYVPFSIEQLVEDKVHFRDYLLSQNFTHVIEVANSLSLGSSAKSNSLLGPMRGSKDYLIAVSPAIFDKETVGYYLANADYFRVREALKKAPNSALTIYDIIERYYTVNGLSVNESSKASLISELDDGSTGTEAIIDSYYRDVVTVLNADDVLFTSSLRDALSGKISQMKPVKTTGSDILNHNMGHGLDQQTLFIVESIGKFLDDAKKFDVETKITPKSIIQALKRAVSRSK